MQPGNLRTSSLLRGCGCVCVVVSKTTILYQHIKAQSSSNIGKVETNGTEKLSDSHCYVMFASKPEKSIY